MYLNYSLVNPCDLTQEIYINYNYLKFFGQNLHIIRVYPDIVVSNQVKLNRLYVNF